MSSSLVSGRETEASAPGLDPNLNEHVTQILDFVDHSPDLDDSVRDAARRKILNPHLTFATIAEETGVVASTAQRRYKRAEAAAIAAGIAMPQQPDLGEHTLLDDHLDNEQVRELVTS